MPSIALPAVVPTVPTMPSSALGPSDTGAATGTADASADAQGGQGVFAALLNKMSNAGAISAELPIKIVESAIPEAPADPALQATSDLSVLLQGLLLPMTANAINVTKGEGTATKASGGVELMSSAPTLAGPRQEAIADLTGESVGNVAGNMFARSSDDAPDFADLLVGRDAAAISAGTTGNTAENAVAELITLPAEQTGTENQAQILAQHRISGNDRVEREIIAVPTPISSPKWHEDIGHKVSMLIGKEISSAELVLTPPNLGRVEVQLNVSADQTTATFVAATPAAREALEQALPKLREFLADAGINLAQASVGGESQAGQGQGGSNRDARAGQGGDAFSMNESGAVSSVARRVEGLVDTFV